MPTDVHRAGCERLTERIANLDDVFDGHLGGDVLDVIAADEGLKGLVDTVDSVPRVLYGLSLDARQARVVQTLIDRCRDSLARFAGETP